MEANVTVIAMDFKLRNVVNGGFGHLQQREGEQFDACANIVGHTIGLDLDTMAQGELAHITTSLEAGESELLNCLDLHLIGTAQ